MTALKQPSSGNLSTFKAARWSVQVNTGTKAAPIWTWWNGLSKFEPTQDPTMQDDTDIGSDGFKSQQVTATSEDVSAEGLIKGLRSVSGLPVDPGALFVRGKRRKVGEDNEVQLRYWRTDDMEAEATIQNFAVGWKDVGGSNEDLQKFTADLKGRGAPTFVAKPSTGPFTRSLAFVGGPFTAGTFALVINDEPLAPVFGVTAAALKSAIEGLTSITGTVNVTGSVAGGFAIEFLTDNVFSITASGAGLTPAGTALLG
jgi:hypothetical protein